MTTQDLPAVAPPERQDLPLGVSVWGAGFLAEATTKACSQRGHLLALPQVCKVLWFAVDCPVGDSDVPDPDAIMAEMDRAVGRIHPEALIVVSSQVPVGTCARMEATWPNRRFAVQPENIREASALEDFLHQDRIIVGTRHVSDQPILRALFAPFTRVIRFVSPESAEMTKHALNAFLALNITFANEIADLCEKVGADVQDVNRCFRSDRRVGNGPLSPGRGFTGGTLGRDVTVLVDKGAGPVISAIRPSNDRHV